MSTQTIPHYYPQEQMQQMQQQQPSKFVSAFHDDNECSMMNETSPNQMSQNLRAASVVSEEGSPNAHEYNPSCTCSDCQNLLQTFTVETVLTAYVTQHLPYEHRLEQQYGFVPCVGSPYGNVAVRLDPETRQPVEGATPETSNALFFHNHNHTMRPVPRDIRERSLKRYYENNGSNNNARPGQQQQMPQTLNFNNNNNNNQKQQNQYQRRSAFSQAFQAAPVPQPYSQQQQQQQQYNAPIHKQHYQQQQQQQYNNNTNVNYYQQQPQQYSAADVAAIQQVTAYTDAARLGQ